MTLRPRPALLASVLLLIALSPALPARAGVITIDVAAEGAVAEVGLFNGGLCLFPVRSTDGQPLRIDVERLAESCSIFGAASRSVEKVSILLLVPGHAVATLSGTAASQIWRLS